MLKGRYLPTGGATLLFAITTLLLSMCNVKILILSEGRSFKRYYHPAVGSSLLSPLRHPCERAFEGRRRGAELRGGRTPLLKIPAVHPPRGRKEVSLRNVKWSALPSGSILPDWKEGVKKIVSTWGVLLRANREESAEVHPLKNCRWEITTFNFLLQKRTSFLLHIHDNGMVKTSDHLQGTWFYSNYHLTWSVDLADRRVYYTAELLWNGEKSKLVKGIIYEERKRRRFFLPAYFFRKILGSFEGRVSVA
ncbi:hypothetical protein PVIIG_05060 [Plasmodium vivax India VII]|uniref:Uncharacterized protein n=5 Tax=Plasmodium vivax TaxID=5855 RepID=A5K7V0_PLAVS|nr:hypothetical protein, conserved [Plasmodium vivax]KMZ79083.1 hypothetical protein PVIIG_05060 [Plasmodium vivax India VII]KMZ85502.1 hypothetical protein PVBG_02188 [Plasmodium vivax Brazil I]KMZ91378.1 hypothetical protein PVMG_00252 [Plasmodium vivax Mauritania I]EDL44364.1 hypothetical protein, conserved [Plasmodium vivax]CAI7722052.1 conserved Plasmodium protein, unknown function [Plasmodium vivax]|eukprot:XP_001614091.1 hypothetical protein [Plasmodium vivax Sal-1]